MKIISFDQSTQITGYAVFENEQLVNYGIISVKSKAKTPEQRFLDMVNNLNEIICNENPDAVVLENVQFQVSAATTIVLARLQGAIMSICAVKDIPFTMYYPTEWRKILGFKQNKNIKRAELKQSALNFIEDRYGLQVSEDCAESIAIGCAYLKIVNE